MYQHCQNPFAIKQRRKSVDLSKKSFSCSLKQLFAIHFPLATCNVCPLTIPEFFAQTRVLATHSFCFSCVSIISFVSYSFKIEPCTFVQVALYNFFFWYSLAVVLNFIHNHLLYFLPGFVQLGSTPEIHTRHEKSPLPHVKCVVKGFVKVAFARFWRSVT